MFLFKIGFSFLSPSRRSQIGPVARSFEMKRPIRNLALSLSNTTCNPFYLDFSWKEMDVCLIGRRLKVAYQPASWKAGKLVTLYT